MTHVRQSLQNLLKYIYKNPDKLNFIENPQPGHHLSAVSKKSYFYIQLASYCNPSK